MKKRGLFILVLLVLILVFMSGCKNGVNSSKGLDEEEFIKETEKDFIFSDLYDYAQQLGYNKFGNSEITTHSNGVVSTNARFLTDNGFIDIVQQGKDKNKLSYLSTTDKVGDVLVLSMFDRNQKFVLNLNMSELNENLKSSTGSVIEDIDEEDLVDLAKLMQDLLGYNVNDLMDVDPQCVIDEIEDAVNDAVLSDECLQCLNSLVEAGYDVECEDCYDEIRGALTEGLQNALDGGECSTNAQYDMVPIGFITDPLVPLEGEPFEITVYSASVGKNDAIEYDGSINLKKGNIVYFSKNGGSTNDYLYTDQYSVDGLSQGRYVVDYLITEVYKSPNLDIYGNEMVTDEPKLNNRLLGTILIGPPMPYNVIVSYTDAGPDSALVTWTQNQDNNFASYEVHMSTEKRWFEPSSSTLVPGGKVTSRTITSKELYELTPTTEYYVRVRVYNTDGLFSDSDPIVIKIAASKPIVSLNPKAISIEALEQLGFDVTCTPVPLQAGVSSFFVDWGDGSTEPFSPSFFDNSVGVVIGYNHTYKEEGVYTTKVRCKDFYNLWSEWDSKQITVTPSLRPDLIIEKIEWNDTAIAGKDTIIKISIKNIGISRVSQDFYVGFSDTLISGGIEPGGTKVIYAPFRQEQAGYYTIKAVADIRHNIAERKENNNDLNADIRVLEASKPVAEAEVLCSTTFYDPEKKWFMAIKGDNVCFKGGGTETGEYGDMIVKYMWDFDDDGNFDSVSNTGGIQFYTYKNPGLYKVKFVVEDNTGKKDEKTFDIRIIDVYLKMEVKPSNEVNEDDDVEIKYTIYNADGFDVNVKSSGLEWDFDNGHGFKPEAIDSRKGTAGVIVGSGETKTLWEKTTKAQYSGKWRANAVVETQFGYVRASEIITVAGEKVVEIPGIVTFKSDKRSYSLGEKAILSIQTDITFAEFCDWYYKFGDKDWVLVPDRAYLTDGKGSFTQTIGQDGYYLKDIGSYIAYALCSNKDIQLKESNRITFDVNSNTYKLSTNKEKYKKEPVYHGDDPIIFSIDTNVKGISCFVNMLDNQNPSGWRDVCSITTDNNGDATCQTPERWFMEIGTHSAKLVCDNGGESEKINIEIVSCPPGQVC